MSRYKARPWTFTHHDGGHSSKWVEQGVMLSTKNHSLFISDEHIYEVANMLIDTYEAKGSNG